MNVTLLALPPTMFRYPIEGVEDGDDVEDNHDRAKTDRNPLLSLERQHPLYVSSPLPSH